MHGNRKLCVPTVRSETLQSGCCRVGWSFLHGPRATERDVSSALTKPMSESKKLIPHDFNDDVPDLSSSEWQASLAKVKVRADGRNMMPPRAAPQFE